MHGALFELWLGGMLVVGIHNRCPRVGLHLPVGVLSQPVPKVNASFDWLELFPSGHVSLDSRARCD